MLEQKRCTGPDPLFAMQKPDKSEPIEPGRDAAPIDGELIEQWALRYLDRFASSAANLRRVLQRRARRHGGGEAAAPAAPLIDALVARYVAAGVVDDAAYAASRARTRLARGQSLRTIRAGLAAKGIGAQDAAAAIGALRDAASDPDLAAAAAFARRRRLGPYRRAPAERGRELAAFARAGFDRRTAEAVLGCDDAAALAALLAATANADEVP